MPIKIERTTTTGDKPLLKIEFDNGDLTALDDVMSKWKFKDEQGMLRFAIAVLLSSNDNKLFVFEDGKKKTLEPADSLIVGKTPTEQSDGKTSN